MSRISKSIDTENISVRAQGWEGVCGGKMVNGLNYWRICFFLCGDEHVPKLIVLMVGQFYNYTKIIELSTLKMSYMVCELYLKKAVLES